MKKRAILITPLVPGMTGNGLSMRAGVWLECLAQDFEVDLVIVPIYPAHPSAPDFARRLASSVLICKPVAISPEFNHVSLAEGVLRVIENLAASAALVVAFRLVMAELALQPALSGLPRLLDLDDADWIREERLGNHELSAQLARRTSELTRNFNLVAFAQSLDSLPEIERVVPAEVMTVPNCSREPRISDKRTAALPVDLLFVGTLSYEPNYRGLLWFLNEVVPLIKDLEVGIIGANPPAGLLEYETSRVHIHGNVAEVSSWYHQAGAAIVPLFSGSGTRTKILEAWAHQKPVITTSIGIEGIPTTRGSLIADSPEDFAAACLKLSNDEVAARILGNSGHDVWLEHFSFESARRHISLAVEKVVSS